MRYSPPQAAWYLARKRRQRTANSLMATAAPVATATEGVAYAGFAVSASGGAGSYFFTIASGVLPDGIVLDVATGIVSGTPTTAGTYADIVIRVTDIVGNWTELAPFTITVSAP
jgi:hypothetical protein